MKTAIAVITQPLALCALVVSSAFASMAKWSPRARNSQTQFYLMWSLAAVALIGGLFLAWQQLPKQTVEQSVKDVIQTSIGDQSPNVNSSGSGSVTVQVGTPAAHPPKPEEKKK